MSEEIDNTQDEASQSIVGDQLTSSNSSEKSKANIALLSVGIFTSILVLFLLIFVIVSAATADEKSEETSRSELTSSFDDDDDDDDSFQTTTTTTRPRQGAKKDQPIAFTKSADVSDDWTMQIDSFTTNANDIVNQENSFNDPPSEGNVYVIVRVTARYTGDDSGYPGISMSLVGNKGIEYETASVSIPDEFDNYKDIFAGGSISGNFVFEVPTEEVNSLVAYAEDNSSWDTVKIFFALR